MNVSPLLPLTVAVGAPATQVTTPLDGLEGISGLSGAIRFAGTGGAAVAAYLQQSFDDGASWADLYHAHFTASGVALFALEHGAAVDVDALDGGLDADTALNGGIVPLFDQFRLKVVSTGTWSNGLVAATIMPRG